MAAPITVNRVDGHLVVAAPADIVNAALNGAAPLTITGTRATGDTVWLAPLSREVWADDAVTIQAGAIARTIQHPEHGEVLYAYVDTTRLDQAPHLAASERGELFTARATELRAAAMVPSCDNCGDCAECC